MITGRAMKDFFMKISIIIPAYNEEERIGNTLRAYHAFFNERTKEGKLTSELVVVLNGCIDNTLAVVQKIQEQLNDIYVLESHQSGKGSAIKLGFENALTRPNDWIGFVDADMATSPEEFYKLILNADGYDGVIASRYMPTAQVYPPRPLIKRWGSKIFYESLIYLLFGLSYYDFQCGAKIFTRTALARIAPDLTIRQWAFDVELLYLCKRYGFRIKELPTIWYDQAGSKLRLGAGLYMLSALIRLRLYYSPFRNMVK
jgi:glycosyltransferase involved in cell wall biosynthesis